MTDLVCEKTARTITGQAIPSVAQNEATTFIAGFAKVRCLLAKYPAPKRPNRNRPIVMTEDEDDIAASRIAKLSGVSVRYSAVRDKLGL